MASTFLQRFSLHVYLTTTNQTDYFWPKLIIEFGKGSDPLSGTAIQYVEPLYMPSAARRLIN